MVDIFDEFGWGCVFVLVKCVMCVVVEVFLVVLVVFVVCLVLSVVEILLFDVFGFDFVDLDILCECIG